MRELTSKERMKRLFAGQPIDRVPVIPHMEAFAGVMCGMSTYEWYNFQENAYRSQEWCQELFGYDGGKEYDVSSGLAGDFKGGEVVIPNTKRTKAVSSICRKAGSTYRRGCRKVGIAKKYRGNLRCEKNFRVQSYLL